VTSAATGVGGGVFFLKKLNIVTCAPGGASGGLSGWL